MNVFMSSAAGTACRASVVVWAYQHCHRCQWTRFSVVYTDIMTNISSVYGYYDQYQSPVAEADTSQACERTLPGSQ